MFQLLIIAFIIGAIYLIRHIRKHPKDKQAKLTLTYGLYGLAAILLLLVLTGRMHWVGGAIAASLPLIQRFIPIALRLLPFINKVRSSKGNTAPVNKHKMDVEQALKVFGFTTMATETEVIQRHRELIQKNHPDRGGSDFLAAQINEAKDLLIDTIKRHNKNNA